jgi:hypothetical protein
MGTEDHGLFLIANSGDFSARKVQQKKYWHKVRQEETSEMDEMHFVHHIKTKSRVQNNCNKNLETTQRTLPTFSIPPRSKKKRTALKYELFLH